MVSAISSVNKYPVDRETLEVVRRLQSLGVAPTGNISIDRQRLQTAELVKKQQTLAANSEVNLSKLEGTGNDFSSTVQFLQNSQPTTDVRGTELNAHFGLVKSADSDNSGFGLKQVPVSEDNILQYKMIGASQLAELNKLKLGLTA